MAQAMDFAIFTAFRTGSFGSIRTLITRGADANTRRGAADGGTALIAAAFHGRLRECEWLLDMGSDLSVCDNAGNNAASVAEARCHHEVAKMLVELQQKQRHRSAQLAPSAGPRNQSPRKPRRSTTLVRDHLEPATSDQSKVKAKAKTKAKVKEKKSSASTWDQPSPMSAPPTKMLVSLGRSKRDRRTVEEIQRQLKAKRAKS